MTAATFTASANFQKLTTSPNAGVTGTPITLSGSGLTPNTALQLTWGTNTATWSVDPEPFTVDYLGSVYSPISAASLLNNSNSMYVNLATVTTDASGNFSFQTTAPTDFGGNHDIWAVAGGVGVANGSFDLLRIVTISPKSGPVGTPITVTYTSMDANPYGGGGSVLWDNHYVGEIMGNWTRGTASVTIRAAGGVGTHYVQVGDAISFLYMNPIQSPITDDNGGVRVPRRAATPFQAVDNVADRCHAERECQPAHHDVQPCSRSEGLPAHGTDPNTRGRNTDTEQRARGDQDHGPRHWSAGVSVGQRRAGPDFGHG